MPSGDLARDESAAMTPGSRIPGDRELQALIAGAVSPGAGLAPLPGFKLDLSANRNFRKVFFKAGCDCGTAALLSVEVGGDKTLDEIEAALPSLVQRIESQAEAFSRMPCDAHRQFRMGRATPTEVS